MLDIRTKLINNIIILKNFTSFFNNFPLEIILFIIHLYSKLPDHIIVKRLFIDHKFINGYYTGEEYKINYFKIPIKLQTKMKDFKLDCCDIMEIAYSEASIWIKLDPYIEGQFMVQKCGYGLFTWLMGYHNLMINYDFKDIMISNDPLIPTILNEYNIENQIYDKNIYEKLPRTTLINPYNVNNNNNKQSVDNKYIKFIKNIFCDIFLYLFIIGFVLSGLMIYLINWLIDMNNHNMM